MSNPAMAAGEAAGDDASDGEFVDWVPTTSPSTPPPNTTLNWVRSVMGSEVVHFEPLQGGLSSAVHLLHLSDDSQVVLRRYTLTDWIKREPNIPFDEERTLGTLASLDLGVRTPELVASDPTGQHCDVPAVLMTVVPGRPIIDPEHPASWAEKLAETLAGIHEQPVVEGLGPYRRWVDGGRPVPTWTADEDLWRRGIKAGTPDLPAHPQVFLHRDYHPNNIHWADGEICSVVDWLSACNGPRAGDLSHCRWNLVILAGQEVAAHFTNHYRALTGYSEDLRLFDLATVLSGPVGPFPTHAWNALGRADLTSESVAPLIDDWLRVILDG